MFREDRFNHMKERDKVVAKNQEDLEKFEELDKTILHSFDNTVQSTVNRRRMKQA